jgi:ankyrin repeat protein
MAHKPFDRNSVNSIGQTPLSVASEEGHEAVVKLLLAEHGVDPNHKDSYGRTPLASASASGHHGVVRLLLNTNGVDPDSRDTNGIEGSVADRGLHRSSAARPTEGLLRWV